MDLELWRRAIAEFNREYFFECHEILEVYWLKEEDIEQKNLLQGIIHIAVSFFHYRNHNLIGYQRQLEKGLKKLKKVRLEVYAGILNVDLPGFFERIQLSDRLDAFPKIAFIG